MYQYEQKPTKKNTLEKDRKENPLFSLRTPSISENTIQRQKFADSVALWQHFRTVLPDAILNNFEQANVGTSAAADILTEANEVLPNIDLDVQIGPSAPGTVGGSAQTDVAAGSATIIIDPSIDPAIYGEVFLHEVTHVIAAFSYGYDTIHYNPEEVLDNQGQVVSNPQQNMLARGKTVQNFTEYTLLPPVNGLINTGNYIKERLKYTYDNPLTELDSVLADLLIHYHHEKLENHVSYQPILNAYQLQRKSRDDARKARAQTP